MNYKLPENPSFLQRITLCRDGGIHWRYGSFDFSKPGHWIWNEVLERWAWLLDRPRSWKWDIAQRLAYISHRLMGGRSYDTGWGYMGNEAMNTQESIRVFLIIKMADAPESEKPEYNEAMRQLERLGGMAKATGWVEYWKAAQR